ncbi:MAG TPA: hypothetical protein VFH29_06920 [Anaerolineales bacterium]|nr:hypothetical protein [Anaerolineales bacterium]
MNFLIITLRLLHILAGVFWVGAALINAFFLAPTIAATGEAGTKFMAHLIGQARLSVRVTVASYVTVLAGAALYWIDSQGLTSPWQSSGPGIGFGLGALAALVGFGTGQMVGKSLTTINQIVSKVQGAPTPDQVAALTRARKRLATSSAISTGSLIVALAFMATARYWVG